MTETENLFFTCDVKNKRSCLSRSKVIDSRARIVALWGHAKGGEVQHRWGFLKYFTIPGCNRFSDTNRQRNTDFVQWYSVASGFPKSSRRQASKALLSLTNSDPSSMTSSEDPGKSANKGHRLFDVNSELLTMNTDGCCTVYKVFSLIILIIHVGPE